jgi:ribosomal protein L18
MALATAMSFEDYSKLDAVNASFLCDLARSPAYAKFRKEKPAEANCLDLGRLAHVAILEPDRFAAEYASGPEVDLRTKAGKAEWQEALDAADGRELIRKSQYDLIAAMRAACLAHPAAAAVLVAGGLTEATITWDRDGIACKARPDRVSMLGTINAVIDLKTTRNAAPAEFGRSIYQYKYHARMAWYVDACREAGIDVMAAVVVAVESEAPHGVAVYRIDDASIQRGRDEMTLLFDLYKNCVETNRWPGYPEEIIDVGLPAWALARELPRNDETEINF